MDDKISFRRVGRNFNGKVYRGNVIDAYNRLTQPSIPSRSEQVLEQTCKREGFGGSATRFSSHTAIKHPGPGQYSTAHATQPSHSAKGYGCLVSRVPRFKKFQYNTVAPGPGSYNSVLKRATSGVLPYHERQKKRFAVKQPTPAPGTYNPQLPSVTTLATVIFKSNVKRLEEHSVASPAPWQYNPSNTLTRSHSAGCSAVFKQANLKKKTQNYYDPHAVVHPDTGPGPGDYTVEQSAGEVKASRVFVAGELDRFGQGPKLGPASPGPGSYNTGKQYEKAHLSGAVFMSESERDVFLAERRPPGPAFYKPTQQPKKKSFHLNINRNWL